MKVALVIDKYMIGGGLINLYRLVKGMPNIKFGFFAKNDGNGNSLFGEVKNIELFDDYDYDKILSFKPDLIHFNHLKPLIKFIFYNEVYKKEIPLLFTARGLHIHKYEFSKKKIDKLKFYARFIMEKISYTKLSKIIAVSKEDRNWLILNYKLKNVIYIPNGINCGDFFIDKKNNKVVSNLNNTKILKDKFIFFTIARFNFQKAYDTLVRAVYIVNKKLPSDVIFIFLGSGPEKRKILEMIKKYSLNNRIILIDERIENEFLWNLGHVFILPSRWEGLPTVLLEAGCYRKLVIASTTYGNTELIRHKKTGLLFPVEDHISLAETILKAYENYSDLNKLGNNLYHLVTSEYTIERMVREYENLYLQFI